VAVLAAAALAGVLVGVCARSTSGIPAAPAAPAGPASASHPAALSPPPGAGRGCPAAPVAFSAPAGSLTGIQFVSAARGWAVGQDVILATADGGRHWTVQRTGQLGLTSVDFISSRVGWAAGPGTLLATTDGGAHWAALPEPCPPVSSVHFISAEAGFAVAGGNLGSLAPNIPQLGGVVLATSDGGRRWQRLPAPADAQTVCFSGPRDGWLGAGGRLYRSSDGGRSWAQVTAGAESSSAAPPGSLVAGSALMIVQCAGQGSAWALDVPPGASMDKEPHVGYHAGPAGAVPVFAEPYFTYPGLRVLADSPGAYAGPFSAISPSAAAFIDWDPGSSAQMAAPWNLVTGSGAVLTPEGSVGGLTDPVAASFISPRLGWVAGSVTSDDGYRQRWRIVFTGDGGRTWQIQYASPGSMPVQARSGLAGSHRQANEPGDCCLPEWGRSSRAGSTPAAMRN